MKKLLAVSALSLLSFLTTYAQDNKPEANSFGMQYSILYNGNLGQAVQFSGWMKNGLELRGGVSISAYGNTNSGSTTNNAYITTNTTKTGGVSVLPTISLVKHIPMKNNLDFFVGGQVNAGVSTQTRGDYYGQQTTAPDYYTLHYSSSKNPVNALIGGGLVAGANFFFYKNFAVGGDVAIGFNTSVSKGKQTVTVVDQNSGANNPNVMNSTSVTTNDYKNFNYNVSVAGYAGLHLIYYVKVHSKKTVGGDQKM